MASVPPAANSDADALSDRVADPRVLVVDDEEGMRSFLSRTLALRGWDVETAGSAEEGAERLARHPFDLIILDISLPGRSGLEWLTELKAASFAGEVILVTAFADMDTAISALRAGAADFVLKPFRVDQIVNSVNRCLERTRLTRENFVLRRQLAEGSADSGDIVGHSEAIERLRQLVRRVAPTPSTVLIQGESGVGKELVARALHRLSPRAARPFVAVNCAAIAADLIESELFGHVKGAFTGATEARNGLFHYAHGGTLFLDEIGELPIALQSRLLRVLEERRIRPVGSEQEVPVDVRLVVATNRNLKTEVAEGRFRQDLYYRLEVMTLTVPPLRQRREDVPELAARFIERLSPRLGLPPLAVTTEMAQALMAHDWPGNVRELRNFVERSLLFGEFPLDDIAAGPADAMEAATAEPAAASGLLLADVEKRHILAVLAQCQGNKTRAAEQLGVSRKTLDRKCAEWGLGAAAP